MSVEPGKRGHVALVGAGPGDPGLITVRGQKLLEQADVVLYDYLSAPRLLRHCPQAKIIYVGKKAAEHTLSQDEINALLVAEGEAGRKVVRLKGGDPFIFGRGGEECEALAAAGVSFEVVPGITSAIAAAAYAGIPATHRDLNSSFTLITGHEKEENYKDAAARARSPGAGASDVDWSAIARLPCVAFYMGVKSLPRICEKLIAGGMNSSTPAAVIQWGTTTRQRTVVAPLNELTATVAREKIGSPAITIIGRVVELRQSINWFESRPLFGQTILVPRTREQASDLSDRLEALGARVIEAPTIETVEPSDWTAVDSALRLIDADWTIFTSANGVRAAKKRLLTIGLDARAFANTKLAAVGEATAAAIREELCLRVDCVPDQFVVEALAAELQFRGEVAGKSFLLLRADIARPVLVEKLLADGAANVADVSIYETRLMTAIDEEARQALAAGDVNWLAFTSSSTARGLVQILGGVADLQRCKAASIGPVTSDAMRQIGLSVAAEALTHDINGLIEAIVEGSTRVEM